MQNSGPWDPWLLVVENSRLFAQRGHSARCAPQSEVDVYEVWYVLLRGSCAATGMPLEKYGNQRYYTLLPNLLALFQAACQLCCPACGKPTGGMWPSQLLSLKPTLLLVIPLLQHK